MLVQILFLERFQVLLRRRLLIGGMLKDGEKEAGYDMDLATATNAASAPSGLLIPPTMH